MERIESILQHVESLISQLTENIASLSKLVDLVQDQVTESKIHQMVATKILETLESKVTSQEKGP